MMPRLNSAHVGSSFGRGSDAIQTKVSSDPAADDADDVDEDDVVEQDVADDRTRDLQQKRMAL